MYDSDLKIKIGRDAEYAVKISRKRPFWANLGFYNATIMRIRGPCSANNFEKFWSYSP